MMQQLLSSVPRAPANISCVFGSGAGSVPQEWSTATSFPALEYFSVEVRAASGAAVLLLSMLIPIGCCDDIGHNPSLCLRPLDRAQRRCAAPFQLGGWPRQSVVTGRTQPLETIW